MKVESRLFGLGTFMFGPLGLIYGYFTHWHEPVGTVALFLSSGLSALVGFFLWWTGRKLDDRPEDDASGQISDAEGEYGFFSPHSWWPLALAAASAVVFLGLAVGWWLFIIGIVVASLATVGWTFEYFHGENAV